MAKKPTTKKEAPKKEAPKKEASKKPEAPQVTLGPTIQNIPIGMLELSSLSPRAEAVKGLSALKKDLKKRGLITPLIVRPYGKGFEVVSGNRRLMASQELSQAKQKKVQARFQAIPCLVRDLDNTEALVVAFADNVRRVNLSRDDKAIILEAMKASDVSEADIAKELGISEKMVNRLLYPDAVEAEAQVVTGPQVHEISVKCPACGHDFTWEVKL